MIVSQKLATRDASLRRVVAQTVVTPADLDRNEACMGACTTAGAVLREMPNPVDREVLRMPLRGSFMHST
jgi:hypothetical protein